LQSRLLARWQLQQGAVVSTPQADLAGNPQQDPEHVRDTVLAQIGLQLDHMRFELAPRGLGRCDDVMAGLLAEVDALRMGLLERKFLRLMGDARTASGLASLLYLAVAGCYQALSRAANPPQFKEYLKRLISKYLIQQQTP
jgi:hypothetical protein